MYYLGRHFSIYRVTHEKKCKFYKDNYIPVSCIGDGKYVRRHFMAFFAFVQFNDLFCINRQSDVGIDYDTK